MNEQGCSGGWRLLSCPGKVHRHSSPLYNPRSEQCCETQHSITRPGAGRGNSWHPPATPQPGQIAEIWQRRGTLDTASSLVMGTMSPHSPHSVIAD